MKNIFFQLVFFPLLAVFSVTGVFAQQDTETAKPEPQKFALVIGNGNYSNLGRLTNPVNDANDIAAVLGALGFNVEKVLNGNQDQMENAVIRLKDRLSVTEDSYGFFFYAGHGVQSGGENFLIPVDANIPSENFLRNRAVSVQMLLDELNDAGNSLNVVVLDACRDNPFGWSRGGNRGLAIVTRQPADSIIVYATSAGQQASDGDGRNGLFTSQLLNYLAAPGIEVKEIFNRTGAAVAEASSRQQVPAIYNQFFGTAYLGDIPADRDGNPIIASRPVFIGGRGNEPEKFWSVGASLGSSFSAPWVIGTLHGTVAPFKYSFLELGFDVGLASGDSSVNYYSLYPFAHYAFFWPLEKLGLYAGIGGGLLIVSYQFSQNADFSKNYPLAAFTAGINILDMIDVSYTLRTNFITANNKVSVGYVYRFK